MSEQSALVAKNALFTSMNPQKAYIASAAQLACLLEATAPKPGNVSPGRHFSDARYEDFIASAAAIGPVFADAAQTTLGVTIRRAVEAASVWTRSNTNLGMVLLLAPIAAAAESVRAGQHTGSAVDEPIHAAELRRALRECLAATTVDDAREVYAAIRCARAGGLGQVEAQDVAGEPTVTLLEAMRLASNRDGIAYEFATGYEVTFDWAVPSLGRALADGLPWDDAIVETFLTLLASTPDTHIARRAGHEAAESVSRLASAALQAGGVRSASGRRTIDEMDRALRSTSNAANPGTTADLTAAAIFVSLLGGAWRNRVGMPAASRQG